MERVKTSVALGTFGPLVTRFVAGGYLPELVNETPVERIGRAIDGLGDLIDGYELYYPQAVSETTVDAVRDVVGHHDVYAVAIALHPEPQFARGGLVSPVTQTRAMALSWTLAGVDVAAEFGAKVIIWPGVEGYNYAFQTPYHESWRWLIDGIAQAAERCREHDLELLLEPKDSEPAQKIHMRDVGMALHIVHKLRALGISNVKINLDWQNVILTGRSLAETAALLSDEGLLGHQHASAGWGALDDKNIVGTSHFMETLELAVVLKEIGYGSNGERLGYDLYPYTEDGIEAVRQSARHWEFIRSVADRLDIAALRAAQLEKDAIRAYDVVYAALESGAN